MTCGAVESVAIVRVSDPIATIANPTIRISSMVWSGPSC